MRRPLAAAALLALAALPIAARGAPDDPLCRVELRVTPERAFVGQQLQYVLRIVHRRDVERLDWAQPLAFPSFRAEWLPGGSGDAPPGPGGEAVEVSLERRALFPAHAGTLEVPAARLRCSTAERSEEVVVPGSRVTVEEPPTEGRPPDWRGLVGPLEVEAYLKPDRIALGASARLVVALRGPHDLWLVRDPLGEALAGEDVDVFRSPPEMGRDVGRSLRWRRYVRYDLVPHRVGELRVPSLSLPYFDVERGRYARARTTPLRLEVTAAAASAAVETPRSPEPEARAPGGWLPTLAAVAFLAAAVVGLLLLTRRRGRPPRRAGAVTSPGAAVRAALAEGREAAARGDAASACGALARGLRAALEPAVAGAGALSAEELRERAPDPEARALAELLARVERLRFAPGLSDAELRALLADVEALLPPS